MRHGKSFTDAEHIKELLTNFYEHVLAEFENRNEILKKIREIPLSAKTVKHRIIQMPENITRQQVKDVSSAAAYSIPVMNLKDKSDIE